MTVKAGQRLAKLLAFKEEGAQSQGIPVVCRSYKRQRNHVSPRAFIKECSLANTSIFSLEDLY